MSTCSIRLARPEENPALLALWERSVRATHHFLTDADIIGLRPEATHALASLTVWVAEQDAVLLGFLAMYDAMVEALFIEPDMRGTGIGTQLLTHAKRQLPAKTPLRLDVNEQNPAALAFYLSRGFVVESRSPVDSAGRPFPHLHLVLNADN